MQTKSCLNYSEKYRARTCIFSCTVQIQIHVNCFQRLEQIDWIRGIFMGMTRGRSLPDEKATTYQAPSPCPKHGAQEPCKRSADLSLVPGKQHIPNSSPSWERAELHLLKFSGVIQHETSSQRGKKTKVKQNRQMIQIWWSCKKFTENSRLTSTKY